MSVKLELHTDKASRKLLDAAVMHLNSAANSTEVLAKALAPVDTGFMRANISQTETATIGNLRSQVTSAADYSLFVEYGTVNMDAQPFFTPAYESAKRQLANVREIF